jgi:hypothetical protein
MVTTSRREDVVAVTVYLKNGVSVKVSTAVLIDRGSPLLSGPSSGDSTTAATLELQDDKQAVIGKFLLSEVAGYVVEPEMSLEGIAASAKAAASSMVGAARRRTQASDS